MSAPYNLWILNHYAGNLQHGMEYRHFYLARHLRRMGHRVGIVASAFSHLFSNPPETSGWATQGNIDGVDYVWLRGPRYQGNGVMRLANMASYTGLAALLDLRQRLGDPDVVLGSSPHPFVVWNTLRMGKRFGIPTMIEMRDLWPLMLTELGALSPRHPLSLAFQHLENRAFKEADYVLSLWKSADEYMFEHGLSRDRYRFLPNGVELSEPGYSGTHPLLTALDAAKEKYDFIVGYGGSHGHANPLGQVIDACVELQRRGVDNVCFFMVGDGPDKAAAVERSRLLGLDNLIWFEPVPKDVVMAFYERLDVTFIGLRDLPLFKYGPTPNKLMDYLAAGRPIIYAIRSSFDPVADNRLGESISPDDGTALADAIVRLESLPAGDRTAMGARARSFAEREHSYEALAQKLDGYIRELL